MRYLSAFVAAIFLAVPAQAATLTTLFSFDGANGADPQGGLTLDSSGNLFGTTATGGDFDFGTVFKLDTMGGLSTLISFNGFNGISPAKGVIADNYGNLFGTTFGGGRGPLGGGSVFRIDKNGSFSTIFAFRDETGFFPSSNLIFDGSGNLFGTTSLGGVFERDFFNFGKGTLFKIDSKGMFSIPIDFNKTKNLGSPGFILNRDNNIFGGTFSIDQNSGSIFKLNSDGEFEIIVDINPSKIFNPTSIIFDHSGNLFGTTGSDGIFGFGTIFKIDKTGVLYTIFNFNGQNGAIPGGSLYFDNLGNLFGVTFGGGRNNGGTVFKFDTSGELTTLVNFSRDGSPSSGLIADGYGNLFGTTLGGGEFGRGSIFRINLAVPEPSTWAMMLFGFGFVGSALRRRQSRLATSVA